MTTRVYKFGLLPPIVESERARELMFAGHRLKNQLIEIENNYRYAFRLLTADLPEVIRVAEVDAKWKNLKERILQARQDTNSRKAPPELLAEREVLKAESETARAAAKVARKIRSEDPLHAQALADLDERVKILRKLAYEASGVTWGVRALLTDSVRQAAATTPIYANIGFQSFNGTTKRIGVTAPSADGPSFHQLLEAPSSPGGRRKRAILRLRVTDDRRSPTFAEFPMTLHRPIPPGKIVQVTVSMKTEANRERWSAEFVVKEEITAPAHGIGTVAVNVGWRSKTDGVRVLTCVDHEREWTIQISPKIVHQLNKARDLRSIRDNRKNAMTSLVLPLLTLSDIDLVKKVSSHAHKWKSPLRWHRLFLQLRSEGLGDAFPVLRDWYHKDIHLWQWEAAQRRKTINSRKNFYRVIAAELSRKYDTLLIAKADRAKFARIKVAKDATESEKEKAANANRIRSSTYDLELSLIQAFSGRQGTIKILPSENKTKACNECGEVTDFNAAENLEHTCEHCGAFWDQDVNHCRNLHIHFRDNPEDAQTKGGIHSATTKNSKKVERMLAAKAKKLSDTAINLSQAAE